VRQNAGAGEETIAPGMVGVRVGVDHVAYRHTKNVLDELAHLKGLLWCGEGVDDYRPLIANHAPAVTWA